MRISAVIWEKDEIDMLPRTVSPLMRCGVETISIMDAEPEHRWVMHKFGPKLMIRPDQSARFTHGMHSVSKAVTGYRIAHVALLPLEPTR